MNGTPQFQILKEHRLAICRADGLLDAAMAEWVLIYIEKLEATETEPLNRFVDLTGLLEIHLSDAQLCDLAQARRYALSGSPPIRSAFFARGPLACAVARMYEILMEGSSVEVRVFRELEAAAEWLNVPAAILRPNEPAGG